MTLTITFPEELERTLLSRAAASGQDVESFVRKVVAESLSEDSGTVPTSDLSAAEFRSRLEAWIASHPVLDHAVDDSRDSIYSGRD
jgi:plasmid stability protein